MFPSILVATENKRSIHADDIAGVRCIYGTHSSSRPRITDVAIDTNRLERALRPIVMGPKSWLYRRTDVGAEETGWAQSFIATRVLHEIDP